MNHTFSLSESEYTQFTNWSREKGYLNNYNFTAQASVNTETVWSYGPVVTALQRGAILLLDEIDLASNKIMCLQSILEGKGIYLKKTNEMIHPKLGFNVIATANTKGQGSEDGKFIGTNVLNEAFLERFALTFEQEYPSVKTEVRILKRITQSLGIDNKEHIDLFCENLANWGDLIRKSYYEGAVDEIVSTRRLVHIMKAYKIFGNHKKAIEVCLNRFDKETKDSFIDYYEKIEKTNVPQDYDNTGNSAQSIFNSSDSTIPSTDLHSKNTASNFTLPNASSNVIGTGVTTSTSWVSVKMDDIIADFMTETKSKSNPF